MGPRVVAEDLSWCAVQIKRTAFRVAEAGLVRQGYPVFSPKIEQVRRRFGRTGAEQKLLFPGYIFVAVDEARANWRAISHTPGVSRIVTRSSNRPAFVPAPFLRDLMARCDESGCLSDGGGFKAGDQVSVVSGPFAGIVSKIEQIDEDQRIWILLDILGGSRAVAIEPDKLKIAV